MKSIELRTKLCALANSLRSDLSFTDALRYTQELQRFLQNIPRWSDTPRSLEARTLLDLQLRQFLVIIHERNILNVDLRPTPERRYAIIAALEASAALIESHTYALNRSIMALCCTRSDYYSAGLLICHIAYHASKAGGEPPFHSMFFSAKLLARHHDSASRKSHFRPMLTQSATSTRRTCNEARSRLSRILVPQCSCRSRRYPIRPCTIRRRQSTNHRPWLAIAVQDAIAARRPG